MLSFVGGNVEVIPAGGSDPFFLNIANVGAIGATSTDPASSSLSYNNNTGNPVDLGLVIEGSTPSTLFTKGTANGPR